MISHQGPTFSSLADTNNHLKTLLASLQTGFIVTCCTGNFLLVNEYLANSWNVSKTTPKALMLTATFLTPLSKQMHWQKPIEIDAHCTGRPGNFCTVHAAKDCHAWRHVAISIYSPDSRMSCLPRSVCITTWSTQLSSSPCSSSTFVLVIDGLLCMGAGTSCSMGSMMQCTL